MAVSKDKYNSIIKEIAEYNDCGMNVFVNRNSLKVVYIPSEFIHDIGDFDEFFGDDLEEIENNYHLFFKIEPPNSHESYKIMKKFVENQNEGKLKIALITALNNRKPFANFNHIIHNSDFREEWFEHKNQELMNRVKLEFENEMPGFSLP